MKKLVIFSILFCFTFKVESQTKFNNYKFVVVPLQYEFLKGKDTYRLNTLTRVLFKEEGFEVYFTEEQLPPDLFKDRCLAVYPDVIKLNGGPFRKRVQLIIKDCTGNILLESEVGDSKDNNHQKAYNEALRMAFRSVKNLKYKYEPQVKTVDLIGQKVAIVEIEQDEKISNAENITEQKEGEVVVENPVAYNNLETLKIKTTTQGFQIMDSESKIIMTLLNTAAKNVFIVKGKDAIVFKENDKWKYSENDGTSSALKELNIKF